MGLRTPLAADEVATRLAERPGWTGDTTQIEKTFQVDYDTAIRIVGEVGQAAIELEHRHRHPLGRPSVQHDDPQSR